MLYKGVGCIMKSFLSLSGLVIIVTSSSLWAEEIELNCSYTEVTYDAPFMAEPSSRQCPEQRCSYNISWNTDTGTASVNGLDYVFSATPERVLLSREVKNPVMGGMDKSSFSVMPESLTFRGIRHSAPDVKLTLNGTCTVL